MITFVVIFATIFIVYNVLSIYGVFEFVARPRKTVEEITLKRKSTKKKKQETFVLSLCSNTVILFRGILMSDMCYENHEYYIQRLDLRTKYLGRLYTPEEVRGMKALPLLISLLFVPLILFYPIVLAVPGFFLIRFLTYQTMLKSRIADEDTIIENNFINLYLLLYSKLRQGSRARLQGTVENYISTLESTKNTSESKVMLQFSKFFLNLLALYEDHVAVPHLRDNYRSATIVNFCNIATQALNGVENFDNLLTFKMQLTERRTNLMRERRKVILRRGQRSIMAIWVILFIFVAVGWYSKFPRGVM